MVGFGAAKKRTEDCQKCAKILADTAEIESIFAKKMTKIGKDNHMI